MRSALLLTLLGAACGSRPSTCTNPTSPRCTPASGRVPAQTTCEVGKLCLSDGADGGFCVPDTKFRLHEADGGEVRGSDGGLLFSPISGTCNGCGTCRFNTGGFVGFTAPAGCVQEGPDPGCCDQTSTCVWTY